MQSMQCSIRHMQLWALANFQLELKRLSRWGFAQCPIKAKSTTRLHLARIGTCLKAIGLVALPLCAIVADPRFFRL